MDELEVAEINEKEEVYTTNTVSCRNLTANHE